MSSQGICFYVQYAYPLPLLAVCLHSLEKYYNGNVHVVMGDETPDWFVKLIKRNRRVEYSHAASMKKYRRAKQSRNCWTTKPLIHRILPYDENLLLDCDCIFVGNFDPFIFKLISEKKLASFGHNRKELPAESIRRSKIKAKMINSVLNENIDFLPSINGGCVGSAKGDAEPFIAEWINNIDRIVATHHRYLSQLADEYGLSLMMLKHGISVEGSRWNYVPIEKNQSDVKIEEKKLISIHFANKKYLYSPLYLPAVESAISENYMDLASRFNEYRRCNESFSKATNRLVVK